MLGRRSPILRSLLTIPRTICVTNCSRIGTSLLLEIHNRMAKKAEGARIDDIRQIVARLQNDGDKIDLLIQLATDVQTSGNQKLATQLLEDAKQIVNHRATGYEHFEQQLKVARAFGVVDPSRSFELLEPGITQLNELLSAAAMLSGFEINMNSVVEGTDVRGLTSEYLGARRCTIGN